jgi:hypothetical protein
VERVQALEDAYAELVKLAVERRYDNLDNLPYYNTIFTLSKMAEQ